MKSKADKLDVNMLKSVCVDFKKSAYVLDKEALKKSKYNADKKF